MKDCGRPSPDGLAVAETRCEYLVNPLGVETPRPRLSWTLVSPRRARHQAARQMLVASTPELLAAGKADLWDSGKVASNQSIQVPYAGETLRSRQRCHWKVRVWDVAGGDCAESAPAFWEMGLLAPEDWQAQWIHKTFVSPAAGGVPLSPMLRRVFRLDKPVRSARAYICGLGYHELYINGRKVGENVLDPAFTHYDKRALYVTHDVTGYLVEGDNAFGVMLGNGFYNCHTKEVWNFVTASWRHEPKMILQVHVEYADGASEVLVSDATWKASTGPVVFDGTRNGETYDARLEKPGWATADCPDDGWTPVEVIAGPGGVLRSQQMPPIRVTGTIPAVTLAEPRPGVFVFDLGQSFSGWARIRVSGPAGTEIRLRYAEKLDEAGDIDTTNINTFVQSGEFQTDTYILKGEGIEEWEPRFTYHGFRYVQATGFPGRPRLDSLAGRVVHTDFEKAGEFACSNELLNKIHHCVRWATVSNYHGFPTDCPHREKCGWTGDAQLSAEQTMMNFRAAPAYAKWMEDFAIEQRPSGQLPGIVPSPGWGYNWGSGPAWDSAYVNIPWYLYLYCGDARILEEHYEGMRRYVDFMSTMETGRILTFGLGDWCPPVGHADQHKCPVAVTSTGYYYSNARIVSEAAALLGRRADAEKYGALAEEIKAAFLREFYDPADGTVTSGSQTAMACGLYQGLIDQAERGKVLAALVAEVDRCDGHIDCGILGVKYVLNALTDCDRVDVGYRISTQTTFPSWGHWIGMGATTLWENWDGQNSRIHHMFSDIGAWLYKALAGINVDPASPGFKHTIIRPNPVGDLRSVTAEHRSMYGPVRSSWRAGAGVFALEVAVPPNTTATVHVPTSRPDEVKEGGVPARNAEGVEFLRAEGGRAVYAVESGEYRFEAPWEPARPEA